VMKFRAEPPLRKICGMKPSKKSRPGLRFVVLCKSGRTHKLKVMGTRQRARDLVIFYNVIVKPKCGPHKVGRSII